MESSVHHSEQSVEWLYAFDIHCNAYFPSSKVNLITPCFIVKEGDVVTIGECRPLAKTVSFNVIKHTPSESSSGVKKFTAF